jgi:hypothetical protein
VTTYFPNNRAQDAQSASTVTSNLQDLLDAFLKGNRPPEAFLGDLSAYCNATPDSSWEALALLDQYHRRGKLSADHFRVFRHKIEFQALGIPDPKMVRERRERIAAVDVAVPEREPEAPVATLHGEDEVQKLLAALEAERERSRRYRHRIATLAEYGRQHRVTSSLHAMVEMPIVAPAPSAPVPSAPVTIAPTPSAFVPSAPMPIAPAPAAVVRAAPIPRVPARSARLFSAPQWMSARPAKALIEVWIAQHRHLQRPGAWTSAALLVAAATVISGSSSNLIQEANVPVVATTPVTFEAVPDLSAMIREPQTISLSSERFVVLPGKSTATIEVVRTGDTGDVARFKWWTQPAGAKPGKDYVGNSQVAQFDAGESKVSLPVRILANPQRKHTEMFYVVIGESGDATAQVNNGRATVFIMRAN